MEVISNELDFFISLPKEMKNNLKNKSYCFFDIETTGFSRYKDRTILIGVLYPTNNGIKIIQLFANELKDEKELLTKFIGIISKFDILISFNGNVFDIPFLNKRFKYNNLKYSIDNKKNIDLLKVVKKYKNLLNLDNCKLKSIEKYLGIYRKDTISGKESINYYYNYVSTKDEQLKKIILNHNYDDIYYLPKILRIYDLIEEKSNINKTIYLKNHTMNLSLDIRNISFKNEKLILNGKTNILNINNQIHYNDNYTFKWTPSDGLFELSIIINTGKLSTGKSCLYLDQEMYDLPLNLQDTSNYNLPKKFILIKDNKKLINENIKLIFETFIEKILDNLNI
ncbi:ribonuclease H-like domain-containing protein [Clostridium sp. D2Q-14]|uniref:ribonuclease H-like domain-containing protein n=1 Tax=Anaeromonas gelatinilytica TaxID=2683194 RepID=UPI00193C511C|nr:ribonuclease H-like domain-containing protein [Anaeromonas gelatinilytica]MBS4534187.1 ribonuclease H-like domain-containing protein [Anaeromonas gelatinilytica]